MKLSVPGRYPLEHQSNLVIVGAEVSHRRSTARMGWNTAGDDMIDRKTTARIDHLHWTPNILNPGFFFFAVASPPSRYSLG